jgi:hypothetical protein
MPHPGIATGKGTNGVPNMLPGIQTSSDLRTLKMRFGGMAHNAARSCQGPAALLFLYTRALRRPRQLLLSYCSCRDRADYNSDTLSRLEQEEAKRLVRLAPRGGHQLRVCPETAHVALHPPRSPSPHCSCGKRTWMRSWPSSGKKM